MGLEADDGRPETSPSLRRGVQMADRAVVTGEASHPGRSGPSTTSRGSTPKCERIDCNKRFPFLVVKASLIPVLKSCASRCATFDSSRLKPICKTALDSLHEAMPTAVCFGFSYGNISDTLIQAEGSSLRRLK